MNDLKYWIAFSKIEIVGPLRFDKIYSYFPDMKSAYGASLGEFVKAGLQEKIAQKIIEERALINPDEEYEKVEKGGIEIITIKDEKYPKLLREIYDSPFLLYYKGNIDALNKKGIAVVGSRRISNYGKQTASFIVRELARNGLAIFSGMALGVDTIAHETALEEGAATVAVLGSGIDVIYPVSNRRLFERICANGGAVISEYSLGVPPLAYNFPRRNRIVSGMSLAVLVIEAMKKSGALITARTALDQNREVFAVPGSIFSQSSEGTNDLLKKGAHLALSADDILEVFDIEKKIEKNKNIAASVEEDRILNILSDEPLHIDMICRKVEMDAAKLSSSLMMMEMKGMVKNLGGNMYVIGR